MDAMTHPLGALIEQAHGGRFPRVDGSVTVLPPVRAPLETVMAFTGHAVVCTAQAADVVLGRGPDGFGGAVAPRFLLWLAGPAGIVGSHDVVLVARSRGGGMLPVRRDHDDHPRVRHARSLRDDVVVHGDDRGIVTLGIGLGGLRELNVEVAPPMRNRGLGRALVGEALDLVPAGEIVVAEVAPGNALSLRAFLASGFTPVGSAVHMLPARPP
jgi:GNAT superfamily N-acetyltransferase